MKRWFLILMTIFILSGCSNKLPDTIKDDVVHEYFCDKFLLTVDGNQYDLTAIIPELSSVSELYPITDDHLYILGRINETYNALMIYDFSKILMTSDTLLQDKCNVL